jgi:hypothetical protein
MPLSSYNSAVYSTKPVSDFRMSIVTPEFPSGKINVTKAWQAYNWRRHQPLSGLVLSPNRNRAVISQPIDGNDVLMSLNLE